jgi:hypothetical protein
MTTAILLNEGLGLIYLDHEELGVPLGLVSRCCSLLFKQQLRFF